MDIFKSLKNKHLRYKYRKYLKFMTMAESIGALSKGRNTKVGCVLLTESRVVISSGYNGATRGCKADNLTDQRNVKPEKYFWIEHAERNSIYNAARLGVSTEGSVAVITHMPCMDCARALVQVGVKTIVVKEPTDRLMNIWEPHIKRSRTLFDEVGIDLIEIK